MHATIRSTAARPRFQRSRLFKLFNGQIDPHCWTIPNRKEKCSDVHFWDFDVEDVAISIADSARG